MSEAEPQPQPIKNLEIGEDYSVTQDIFNTTVLHPSKIKLLKGNGKWTYWQAVSLANLEQGDELAYIGTAAESNLVSATASADVLSESLVFKPGKGILERYQNIQKEDVLGVEPNLADRFSKK
jgi:hypothetical protein